MADSQLLALWEYEGEVPQVVEAGELIYSNWRVQFEWLEQNGVRRFVMQRVGDDGSWTLPLCSERYSEALEESIPRFVKQGFLWREFRFGTEAMIIYPNGVGQWRNESHEEKFSLGGRISRQISSQTYQRVSQLLSRSSSDVSFARRFGLYDYEQKLCYVFGSSSVDELMVTCEELDSLCRLALYAYADLWRETAPLCWRLLASNPSSRKQPQAHFYVYDSRQSSWRALEKLNKWAKIIERYGPLRSRQERMCVREVLRGLPTLTSGLFDAPTMHEQMEARLELEEWGRRNLPFEMWLEV